MANRLNAIEVEVDLTGGSRRLNALLIEAEIVGGRRLNALLIEIDVGMPVLLIVSATQSQSASVSTTYLPGGVTYPRTVTASLGQVVRLGQLTMLTRATTQAQSVALWKAPALIRTLQQSTTTQLLRSLIFGRLVQTTQSTSPRLARSIALFRRITQQQNTPLVSRVIQHAKVLKKTGTTTQRETVVRGGIFRTVSTTQSTSVTLVRQPRLIRRVIQSQSMRLVRGIAQILRVTQAQSLVLKLRNSSLILAITQATSARLSRSSSLTQIVLQQTVETIIQLARLTRSVTQSEQLSLTSGGQVLPRGGSATQSTNVSLIQTFFPLAIAQQAQAVSLQTASQTASQTALQAQACTLLVQPLPRTPIQPTRVFAPCRVRRLVYSAGARRTTFQARPRQTVFVARFVDS